MAPKSTRCSCAVGDASTFYQRGWRASLWAAATWAFPKSLRAIFGRSQAEATLRRTNSSPTLRGRHGPSFPKFESNRAPGETQSDLVWTVKARHFCRFSFDTKRLRRLNYRNNGTRSCAGCCVKFVAIQAKFRTAREQQITSAGREPTRFFYADVALGCLSCAFATRLACSFSSLGYFSVASPWVGFRSSGFAQRRI